MPVFSPNDYLFETYALDIETSEITSEMPRWSIFGQAVREAISERSGLRLEDKPHKEKLAYAAYMQHWTEE